MSGCRPVNEIRARELAEMIRQQRAGREAGLTHISEPIADQLERLRAERAA